MSDCSRVYSPVSLDGWELAGANTYFILGGVLEGNSKRMLFQLFIHSPVPPPDRSSLSISWPPDIAPGNGDKEPHSNWRREGCDALAPGGRGCLRPHHRSAAFPVPPPRCAPTPSTPLAQVYIMPMGSSAAAASLTFSLPLLQDTPLWLLLWLMSSSSQDLGSAWRW